MDRVAFATAPAVVAAFLVSGVTAAAFAAGQPPPGRLLLGVATVLLVGEGLRNALLRPTLAADVHGFSVVRGLRRHTFAWSAVKTVGAMDVSDVRKLRRNAKAVEIDLGTTLVVVPAYRLGRPVPDVVAALDALRDG